MMGDYFGGMPLPRKKAANKIFVGGLHWETTDEKLRKHFMLFGEVIDAVVMKDPISRRSRGFGFITFADAAAVDRVLSQDNHILDSRRVEAKRAVPRSETLLKQQQEPLMQPPTPPTRPLPASALMGLQQHMHGMGGGLQGTIPQQSSSAAAAAAAALIGGGGQGFSTGPPPLPLPPPYHQMGGPAQHGGLGGHGPSGMGMSMGMGMGGLSSTHKIFVGGLHYETKDAEFRAYFERFGHVISAEVMFNRETHKSRGFGFVVFEDEAAVERVLQLPQHAIDGKMVEVKRAIPRNQVASPIMGASAAGLGGGLPGGPPRGLSPSFTTGGGLGPAGGLGGGKYPPALSLDKGGPGPQGRPAHSPSSYAQAVLQQRGGAGPGRAIHGHPGGDLAALAEEMGGMSLQGKQRQQQEALLGALAGQGAGAGQWTGLEHLLDTMEGQQQAQQQQHYEAAMREQAQYLLAQQQQQQQQQQGVHMPPGLDPTEPYGSTAVGQQHHSAHHPGAGQGQQGAHRPMDSRYNFASAGPGGAAGAGAGAGAGQPGGSGGGNEGLLWPAGPPRHYAHTGEAPPQQQQAPPQQPKAGSAPATPHLHGMPPPAGQEMPPPLGSAGSIPGRPPADGGPGSGSGRRTLSWEAILYPGAEGARGAGADGGEGPPSASSSSSQAGLPSHY